jgi:hypothetical protein
MVTDFNHANTSGYSTGFGGYGSGVALIRPVTTLSMAGSNINLTALNGG